MKKKAVWRPEEYCPICGDKLTSLHRCRESVLRAIDGARDRRDPDTIAEQSIPEGRRLADGMFMLRLSETDE